jgi:RNA binding exosome subunit
MKLAHHIEMRVYCKEEDNEQEIINKIHELFPFDFDKEKIEFRTQSAETFDGKKMKILTVFIKKDRQTNEVLRNLFFKFSEDQKNILKKQLESRLDERLHFYIRLEKPALLNGEYKITDSGNCFHFNISIAAYPHKRTVARKIVESLIENSNIKDLSLI